MTSDDLSCMELYVETSTGLHFHTITDLLRLVPDILGMQLADERLSKSRRLLARLSLDYALTCLAKKGMRGIGECFCRCFHTS